MFLSGFSYLAFVCLLVCPVQTDEPERGDGLAVDTKHPRELALCGLRDPE